MKAETIFKKQLEKDLVHHQDRLKWLKAENPKWACGTPVTKSDRYRLIHQSEQAISDPTEWYNSAR